MYYQQCFTFQPYQLKIVIASVICSVPFFNLLAPCISTRKFQYNIDCNITKFVISCLNILSNMTNIVLVCTRKPIKIKAIEHSFVCGVFMCFENNGSATALQFMSKSPGIKINMLVLNSNLFISGIPKNFTTNSWTTVQLVTTNS